jgi:polyisoprenoid-binding protein YceI
MKRILILGAIALSPVALIKPAAADPMVLPLTAGNMLAQTHSHAIVLNITGTYQQLAGTLNYDLAAKTCHVDVTFQVASLALPNALVRSQVMNQSFLDPTEYPTTVFTGDCQDGGTQLVGNLTLRGQTHPFTMAITYVTNNNQVTSIHTEGTLNRYDWGLNGNSMTVGKMIKVTNDISLNGQPPAPPPAS